MMSKSRRSQSYAILMIVLTISLVNIASSQTATVAPTTAEARNTMLSLINAVRAQKNVPALVLDERLNAIAQAHSADMLANNYFAHINLSGAGPQQRANANGFYAGVSENIGYGPNTMTVHYALMNSAPHLYNTIDSSWALLGVGAVYDSTREKIIITILFSGRDYSKGLDLVETQKITKDIQNYIASINSITHDPILSNHIKTWTQLGRTTSIFQYLYANNYYFRILTYQTFRLPVSRDIVAYLKQNNVFFVNTPSNSTPWKVFGFDLTLLPTGVLQIFVVFAR